MKTIKIYKTFAVVLAAAVIFYAVIFASCSDNKTTSAAASDSQTQLQTQNTEKTENTEAAPETETATETETAVETEPATETESATETEPEPQSIALNASEFALDTGYSVYLKAYITPATSAEVAWSSSDSAVASVDQTGKVTAKTAGKATVTASAGKEKKVKAECVITVNAPKKTQETEKTEKKVTAVILGAASLDLKIGESHTFSPAVSPSDASDLRVSLKSDNTSVVKVSGFTVTAMAEGKATLTAEASDGGGAKVTCAVTVTAVKDETAAPETEAAENPKLPLTATPYCVAKSYIKNGVVCVSGSCEEGAVVTIEGSLVGKQTVEPQQSRFFFSVTLKKGQSDTLTVTAKVEGKRTSEPSYYKIQYGTGNADVTVGKISQLHYPMTLNDYYGNNLFSDSELDAIYKLALRRLQKVREKTGVDTKLIYFVAPNNLTIYPETAQDEWTARKKTDDSRRKQFVRLLKEKNNPDIIVVDPTDFIFANKDKGKLYFQTDTHWNTLGAYFGYYKLMEAISADFPDAAPYALDSFNVKKVTADGGDLVRFLGFDVKLGGETTYTCALKGKSLATVISSDGAIPSTNLITSEIANDKLPTAVVMRDSFGYAIQQFLFEHFKKAVLTPQSCGLETAMTYLEDNKPDYFIHILIERYIDQLLGG